MTTARQRQGARGGMSFFKKLKDRMFNSSSRLDAGLEAIVEQGTGEEAEAPEAAPHPEPPAPIPEPAPPIVNDGRTITG